MYEIFIKFMARWTREERERFEEISSHHYPECPMTNTIQMLRQEGPDNVPEIGPSQFTREAARMMSEPTNYYTDYPARGSKRRGDNLWCEDEFSGEITPTKGEHA